MFGIALQKHWESIQAVTLSKNSYPDIPAANLHCYALRVYFLCVRFKDILEKRVNWENVEKLPGAAQAMCEAQAIWEIVDSIGPDGTVWWKKILEDSRNVFGKFCARLRYGFQNAEGRSSERYMINKQHSSLDVYFQKLSDLATIARNSMGNGEIVIYPDELEEIVSMSKSLPLIYAEYTVNSTFAAKNYRITRDKACKYVHQLISVIYKASIDCFVDRPEVIRLFSNDYRRRHRPKKS
jgi:hypothetical protein